MSLLFWWQIVLTFPRELNVVAPDGLVSLPRAGVVRLADKTIQEATDMLEEKLSQYYEEPEVNLSPYPDPQQPGFLFWAGSPIPGLSISPGPAPFSKPFRSPVACPPTPSAPFSAAV